MGLHWLISMPQRGPETEVKTGTRLAIKMANGHIRCQSLIQSGLRPSPTSEIGPRPQAAWSKSTLGPSHLLGHPHSVAMHCRRHTRAKIASHLQSKAHMRVSSGLCRQDKSAPAEHLHSLRAVCPSFLELHRLDDAQNRTACPSVKSHIHINY